MSHQSTLRLFDAMGRDFDSKVLEWKSAVEAKLSHKTTVSEVSIYGYNFEIINLQVNQLL